jgi:hypothetical protein
MINNYLIEAKIFIKINKKLNNSFKFTVNIDEVVIRTVVTC